MCSSRKDELTGYRAVMQLNPGYLEIAKARDREREDGHVRGKLHEIPFLVKDNIGCVTRPQMSGIR